LAVEREVGALLVEAGVDPGLVDRLAAYAAILLEATRTVNLTAARTPQALVPHVLDALSLAPLTRGPLIDVGSGGGLPGIPLALATGVPVTLVEAIGKKAAFLERATALLGLPATVCQGRAEALGHDRALRGRFLTATARAVGPATTVAELTLPFLAIGGWALLQRGAIDERERAAVADAAPVLGGELLEERRLEGERRILIVEKRGPTPQRFPRRIGVPAKRPLCHG
jgi:16S rRNA (guanine527-N7)-methyltransferase